ncbi:MAG: class I SAM-dependent methyltransferase [Bacteroidota bacterium]
MNRSICPTCNKPSDYLLDWAYSGLNKSVFNYIAKYYHCQHCGLVYIKNISDKTLAIFYSQECSYFEKDHFDITSPENIKKYSFYKEFIIRSGLSNVPVTDIGCGRGGFLTWLVDNQWDEVCLGVDIDIKSIPSSTENKLQLSFLEGKAVDLPFARNSQSLLTYFHVFEHIHSIDCVLDEAVRVLHEDGHILIEVPDAQRYKEYPVGTAFWFGIREHIYHFTSSSLVNALIRYNFEIINISQQILPTPEFSYPSLIILAKKVKKQVQKQTQIHYTSCIQEFIVQSQNALKAQTDLIQNIYNKKTKLIFWGCSSELFSLLPTLNIQNYTLCDSSKQKQNMNYKGLPIEDPISIPTSGTLIIAPYLHSSKIEQQAINLGWQKKDIIRLK